MLESHHRRGHAGGGAVEHMKSFDHAAAGLPVLGGNLDL
jgi:hypothetical protein